MPNTIPTSTTRMIAAAAPRRTSSVRSSARDRRAPVAGRRGCGRRDPTAVRGSSPSSKNDKRRFLAGRLRRFLHHAPPRRAACKFHIIAESVQDRSWQGRTRACEHASAPAVRHRAERGDPAAPRPRAGPLPAARADRLRRSRDRLDGSGSAGGRARRAQARAAARATTRASASARSVRAVPPRASSTRRSWRCWRPARTRSPTTWCRSTWRAVHWRRSTARAACPTTRCSRSARRSPARSSTRTSAVSCTATSSRRT